MDSFKYSAVALAAVVIIVFLKEYNPSFGLLLRIGFSIGAAISCAVMFGKIFEYIKSGESILGLFGEGLEIFRIMLKAAGIAFIGAISSSVCRDSGEAGIASTVETISKLEIILLAIPVIEIIFEKIREVIS